jgi:hypothetical protein
MSHESGCAENAKAADRAGELRLEISCQYALADETVRILVAIVQGARKSEERHQSEAA